MIHSFLLASIIRGRGNPQRDIWEITKQFHRILVGGQRVVVGRSPNRRLNWLNLECIVEQPPRSDSRVTLANTVDRFGVPLSRIDWKIGEEEARTVRTLAQTFCEESNRLGLPIPRLADWVTDNAAPLLLPDSAHPMGTTRMSLDPCSGVVDTNCAVHGVAGLYVAGSSVFPTAGHANPTQVAVALSLRLSDHLQSNFHPGETGKQLPNVKQNPVLTVKSNSNGNNAPLILVTGASGKIGSVLLPRLIAGGFNVRALTSQMREKTDSHISWVVHDLRQEDLDFKNDLEGCIGILHLGAELNHPEDMWRTNVEATRALARDAERCGVRFMGYLSSVSVYGSSRSKVVDENTDTLTYNSDIKSEYWANSALRAYGRTKLGGELAIRDEVQLVEHVIFRPTVVVNEADVAAVLKWSAARRVMCAYRNANHIYVGDVVEACVWALERSLKRPHPKAGVEVFNLADNTLADPSFKSLFQEASKRLNLPSSRNVLTLPGFFDWAKDYVRYRGINIRYLLGQMRFSTNSLERSNFRLRHGMSSIRKSVFEKEFPASIEEG